MPGNVTLGILWGQRQGFLPSGGCHPYPHYAPRLTVQLGLAVMLLAEGPVTSLRACPHLDQVTGSSLQPLQLCSVFRCLQEPHAAGALCALSRRGGGWL